MCYSGIRPIIQSLTSSAPPDQSLMLRPCKFAISAFRPVAAEKYAHVYQARPKEKVSGMPNHVLLLGAGFSRNWNAPLAAEVANSLLEEVGADAHLQSLLRRHSKNFENALSEVQRDYLHAVSSVEAKERLDRLQGAIATMFGRLNATFEPPREFEFCNEREYSVSRFLAMFDSIFNLNQDLLLEMRYRSRY